ncbi:MAG: class I SAM-dependent methyltransferase, partial [Bacteroidales bacterium]|nr:class I SAM-dependent methyltransferase [Bacteroidales bacterium]
MYEDKDSKYFNNPRTDLIGLIPNKENNKILEIGSGGGDTLIEIKRLGLAKEVVGIDVTDLPNSNQNSAEIDKLLICDIEDVQLNFQENYFDVIICGDVLEHLIDPLSVLRKLHLYLKQD